MTSPRHLLAAAALVAGLALAGCGDGAEPQAAAATSAPSSAPATTSTIRDPIMCANIERALRVWEGQAPVTAADVLALNKVQMGWAMDETEKLLDGVEGYEDPNAKMLTVAVAEYNVALGFANVALAMGGEVDADAAATVEEKAADLREKVDVLRGISCSGA